MEGHQLDQRHVQDDARVICIVGKMEVLGLAHMPPVDHHGGEAGDHDALEVLPAVGAANEGKAG